MLAVSNDTGSLILFWQNSEGKFQPGRIDMFTIEAVDLGDPIESVSINVAAASQHTWHLDRVTVKRGYYAEREQVFLCARCVLISPRCRAYSTRAPYRKCVVLDFWRKTSSAG